MQPLSVFFCIFVIFLSDFVVTLLGVGTELVRILVSIRSLLHIDRNFIILVGIHRDYSLVLVWHDHVTLDCSLPPLAILGIQHRSNERWMLRKVVGVVDRVHRDHHSALLFSFDE